MKQSTKLMALMGISLLSFTGFLDATIVSTALSSIQINLHMSVTQLQWIMNAFFLGLSALMASMGRVADIYGRRKVFYIGTIIFGVASLGAGLATEGLHLIIFRAIQGIATAITIPVGITLIQTIYTKEETAKAMGIFGAITGAGLALGPVIGGGLVTLFGWPSVFFVNVPFIVIGFSLCLFSVKESKSVTQMSLDYFGILFLVLTIVGLVFAVVEGDTYGWQSKTILTSSIVFLVSLILLIITESRVQYPIMSGSLFKNKVFISVMLFSFATGGLMAVILFIDPLYLNLIIHKSVFITGVLLFIMPSVVMLSSPIIGQFNHRFGAKVLLIYGAIFNLIAIMCQMFFSINLNYELLILGFVIFGLGWAIMNQAPAVSLGLAIPNDHLSVAMGALFSFYNIGAAVMLAIGVNLFHWQAMNNILYKFSSKGISLDTQQRLLIKKFISQPDKMEQVILQLGLTNFNLHDIFRNAFMVGMHAMFWPLIILILIAFFAITYIMKNDKSSHD